MALLFIIKSAAYSLKAKVVSFQGEQVAVHASQIFTAKPEGEWISRGGHLKQVFQSNV